MSPRQIARFFYLLAKRFDEPCTIILTGAGAGAIYGRVRATLDLDFALRFKTKGRTKKEKLWKHFDQAVREVTSLTGIAAQYAEDIDRWSAITFLDYEKHTRRFQKFGTIEVRLLEPGYWAIGKLARYLDPDIRDLVRVLKKTKTSWSDLVRLAGLALRKSPKSTSCFLFRRQVEDFLSASGRALWGKSYSAEKAVRCFRRHAGMEV